MIALMVERVHIRHVRQRTEPVVIVPAVVLAMSVVLVSGCRSDQLGGHQLGIQAVACQQIVVAALFNRVAVVQNYYPVGVPDSG